jgi:hypothetical protein
MLYSKEGLIQKQKVMRLSALLTLFREAKKAASKDIKTSVLLINSKEEMDERVGKKIADIGDGMFFKVATEENLPLKALRLIQ